MNLEQQIDRAGLNSNVYLLGRKGKKEIGSILCNSDVFVLPSRSETFGVVYVEAMMMGLPVIATVCGGPEEFVQKTDGLLVPCDESNYLLKQNESYHPCYLSNNYSKTRINVFQEVMCK